MKRLLLLFGLLGGLWASPALAQTSGPGCLGVGGVNNVPIPGVICNMDSSSPTYVAVTPPFAPGTTPQDISCLAGSATKVVRLKQVRVSGTAGTAINVNTYLIYHNALDTAQAGTAITSLAIDPNSPSPTALGVSSYTSNPTLADSTSRFIDAQTVFLPVTSTAAGGQDFQSNWQGITYAAPALRNASQEFCVNMNGVTAPSSGLVTVEWVWTENNQ